MSKSALKIACSLHHKKNRQANGQFLVEGEKLVTEALAAGLRCRLMFARRSWYERHPNVTSPLDSAKTDCIWLGDSDMERISQLSTPPPIIGLFEWKNPPLPAFSLENMGIWLYLDRIRDAGNLGTLLRIADWFGVEGVWTAPGTADSLNAKSIQASMGSVFRVPVVESEPTACLEYLRGIPVYAATLNATAISTVNFDGGGLLVLGNESEGLDPEWLTHCHKVISIPGFGRAESLNAAVAAGIILSWMKSEKA
jgi:TrmH family RNA methyltransferase